MLRWVKSGMIGFEGGWGVTGLVFFGRGEVCMADTITIQSGL
jgi:hypothetical protein